MAKLRKLLGQAVRAVLGCVVGKPKKLPNVDLGGSWPDDLW
jgi:hypothetical protein